MVSIIFANMRPEPNCNRKKKSLLSVHRYIVEYKYKLVKTRSRSTYIHQLINGKQHAK